MFCQQCGAEIEANATSCKNCGAAAGSGPMPMNAPPVAPPAAATQVVYAQPEGRSWVATLLLCFFVGVFGVHRFYTGHIVIGVVQLLTGGMCGIWTLIDFILILAGAYKDAEGRPLYK